MNLRSRWRKTSNDANCGGYCIYLARAKVSYLVEAHMRDLSEKHKDPFCVVVEDTFCEAVKITAIDLED